MAGAGKTEILLVLTSILSSGSKTVWLSVPTNAFAAVLQERILKMNLKCIRLGYAGKDVDMFTEFIEAVRMMKIERLLTPLQVLDCLFSQVLELYANRHELFQMGQNPENTIKNLWDKESNPETLTRRLEKTVPLCHADMVQRESFFTLEVAVRAYMACRQDWLLCEVYPALQDAWDELGKMALPVILTTNDTLLKILSGFSNWSKWGSLRKVSAVIIDEADKLRWEEVLATLSGFSLGMVVGDYAQELQILRDCLHTRYGRYLRSGPHESAPDLNTSFFKSFYQVKKDAPNARGTFFNFHEIFETFRFPAADTVDMLNDALECHFVSPQDSALTRTLRARPDGVPALVLPIVFHNSKEWESLDDPRSQTRRSVVCSNLTMFAALGFIIQAELSNLLAHSTVDELEANAFVVTCHYRIQLACAKDFLQRYLATIEWAHQEQVEELFEKGVIGFMGPRAVSGTSTKIVLWLFMRRAPYDHGPKGIMVDHSYLYVALSRRQVRLYPLYVDVTADFSEQALLQAHEHGAIQLASTQDLQRYRSHMAPESGSRFPDRTFGLRANRAKELLPFLRLSRHLFEINYKRCQPKSGSRFMPTSWGLSKSIRPPMCFWDKRVLGPGAPEFLPECWDRFAEAAEAAFEETKPKELILDQTEAKVADQFFGSTLLPLIERLLQEKSDTQLPDFSEYGGLAEKWAAKDDYPEWAALTDNAPMAVLADTTKSMIDAITCSLKGGSQAMVEVPILAPIWSLSNTTRTLEEILESLTSFTCHYLIALEGLPQEEDDPRYFFECGRRKAAEVAIAGTDEKGAPEDRIYVYKQCTSDRPAFTIRRRAPALQDAAADDKAGSTEAFGPQGSSTVMLSSCRFFHLKRTSVGKGRPGPLPLQYSAVQYSAVQ